MKRRRQFKVACQEFCVNKIGTFEKSIENLVASCRMRLLLYTTQILT